MTTPVYDVLEPRLFRAFMAAAETLNFTEAARLAAMTQSGVSQHVARLEAAIGVALFRRVGKEVQLTPAGRALVGYVERQADLSERFLNDVRAEASAVAGLVSYAMPPGCLMSPHLPMLIERRKSAPGVDLRVTVVPNDEVYDLVHDGSAHFGFVTAREADPAFAFTPFCDEEFVLVARDAAQLARLDAASLVELPFVVYPGFDGLFAAWRRRVFPKATRLSARELRVSVTISHLEGALVAARAGAGLTVLPRHCVERAVAAGELTIFARRGLAPALNRIHIVTLAGGEPPRRVRTVIDWFLEMHP
jgi:DNA-binding transcriptional LysR family regulator